MGVLNNHPKERGLPGWCRYKLVGRWRILPLEHSVLQLEDDLLSVDLLVAVALPSSICFWSSSSGL